MSIINGDQYVAVNMTLALGSIPMVCLAIVFAALNEINIAIVIGGISSLMHIASAVMLPRTKRMIKKRKRG